MIPRVLLAALVASILSVSAPRAGLIHSWSHSYGDTSSQYISDVVFDPQGNIVVCGAFRGGLTIDTPFVSQGSRDIVIAKFDPSGFPVWSRQIGEIAADTGWDVTTDIVGNVLLAGSIGPTLDNRIAILAKYSSTGTLLWTNEFGASGDSYTELVVTDSNKHIIVAGTFTGLMSLGGPPLQSTGTHDIFVAKFNASGTHLWSKRFGTGGEPGVRGLAIDATNQPVLFGEFDGNINFGGATLSPNGPGDLFLVRFNTDGGHVWSKQIGGPDYEYATKLAMNPSGSIAIAGSLYGDADLGGGTLNHVANSDPFLAVYTPSGSHVWSACYGGTGWENPAGLAWASNGDLLLTCQGDGGLDFGGGTINAAGPGDLFVARFFASGSHRWSTSFTTPGGLYAGIAEFDGGIVIAGWIGSETDMGGGPLAHVQDEDVLIARFGDSLPVGVGATPAPAVTSLEQNVPNPFNPRTTIAYSLDAPARVIIEIFDARGTRVTSLDQGLRPGGSHAAAWNGLDSDGRPVASGVYLYRIAGMPQVPARKMTLLK